MSCPEVSSSFSIAGQPMGLFNYTFRDVQESGATIEQIGVLAWGCAIFTNPKRKLFFADLLDMFNNNPDMQVKEAIQQIDPDEVEENPNFDVSKQLTEEYYILTKAGAIVDSKGNVIKKVRNLSIVPLMADQVNLLLAQGFDVARTSSMDITSFIAMFQDPINMNGQPVNEEPITLFSDGGQSAENEGVFDSRINEDTATSPNIDINPSPLNSDKTGTIETFVDQDGHIVTGIREGGEGTLRITADNVIAPAGTPSVSGVVLPLGILLLLSGQLG